MNWRAIEGTLYGRDDLIDQLLMAYDRNCCCDGSLTNNTTTNGNDDAGLSSAHHDTSPPPHDNVATKRELLLLAGSSGVGKTEPTYCLQERVRMDQGYFLTGKFDQVAATNRLTAKSYGPFIEAFTTYIHQVINDNNEDDNEDDDDNSKMMVKSIRQALLQAMSESELMVLLETLPALNTILHFCCNTINGSSSCCNSSSPSLERRHQQQEVQQRIVLRGVDAEERFISIFCKFVHTISSQGSPIVLLLDDIQWLNQSSLTLLRAVAAMERNKTKSQLLILCTCRNDDLVAFDQLCGDLQQTDGGGGGDSFVLTTMQVSSMNFTSVHKLASDLLQLELSMTKDLAIFVFSKTQGNVFHMLQLLKAMEQVGTLSGNDEASRLCLTTDGPGIILGDDDVHSSVMRLLDRRISRLPDKIKNVLKVAACLGNAFSEACLVAGTFLATPDVLDAIQSSQAEGLVVMGSNAHSFRFPHDKFQQAAYMLIPDDDKDAFHLNVGLRLWHWLPLELRDEHVLLVADQVSRGIRLIKDKEDRDDLAKLFLQAGNKAATASSFASAAAYFNCGIELLNHNHWDNQYNFTLALCNAAVQIEYYCGNFARVDELVTEIIHHAHSFDDTLVARFTKIYSLGSRCEMAQALEESFEALKCLGEPFPHSMGPFQTGVELMRCKWMMRGKNEQAILQSPVLTDKKKVTAMRLMVIMHTFAFTTGMDYWPAIAARVVQMSLLHGIHEPSSAGFALLALVHATRGDVDESYRCGRAALRVTERYQSREWQARVALALYGFAFPLKHPLRDCIVPLREGHQTGLVVGDLHFSILSAFALCLIKFYAGNALADVLETTLSYRKLCLQHGQRFLIPHFDILTQCCLNLMGKSKNVLKLSGEAMKEEDALTLWQTKHAASFIIFLSCKHLLTAYMRENMQAESWSCKLEKAKIKLWPFALVTHHFLQAIASVSISRPQALRHLHKLKGFASHCPENYMHKVLLVEAELANNAGNHEEAMTKYQLSIDGAAAQGFLQEKALAYERAAYALRGREKHEEAAHYFSQAILAYDEWGAQVKVDQLVTELPTSCQSKK